jgi:hypothetical protein
MNKYKLDKTDLVRIEGRTLYRIVAIREFKYPFSPEKEKKFTVEIGEKGGYIEQETNLSQEGDAWVFPQGRVYENAQVFGDAIVCRDAEIYGNAKIYGNAQIHKGSRIFGNSKIHGNAEVFGDEYLCDKEITERFEGRNEISINGNRTIWTISEDEYEVWRAANNSRYGGRLMALSREEIKKEHNKYKNIGFMGLIDRILNIKV